MYIYEIVQLLLCYIVTICQTTDLYREFNEQTYTTSSPQNLPKYPGKCHFKIGNGKVFSVRFYRRFNYPDPNYSCLHFHCTLKGEVKLMYKVSGCYVNNKCLRFGESFTDDECQTWTCGIDYRSWSDSKIIKMGTFLDRMKTQCLSQGKCYDRGEIIHDQIDCITKRCTISGRPLGKWKFGAVKYWKPLEAGCKIDGVCFEAEKVYSVGCATYKCNNKILFNRRNLHDGRLMWDYTTDGGPEFVKSGCKRFNSPGCLEVGDHTKFGQCIEYTCMDNGSNMLTKEGCPNALTGKCGELGEVINPLPCITLQCQKSGNTYAFRYQSEGCYNGSNCTNLGYHGYDPKTDCNKTCQKIINNGMIQYRLAGECVSSILEERNMIES